MNNKPNYRRELLSADLQYIEFSCVEINGDLFESFHDVIRLALEEWASL